MSFEREIKPLFREGDRESMKWAFDLWSRDDVAANGNVILQRLRDGSMPCDSPWPAEQIAVFERWLGAGAPA
jgi:hypothetical protein